MTNRIIERSKKKLRFRSDEAISYLYNFIDIDQSKQVRAIIFAQGRTGSTLLENLLSSTGHFQENGELLTTESHINENGELIPFRKGEVLFPVQYIRGLSKRKNDNNFLFHVKINHLTTDRNKPISPKYFLQEFYRDGWKIIHLKRKNKINQAISNIVGKSRGFYHKLNDDPETFGIYIDLDDFYQRMRELLRLDEEEKAALANIDYHKVVYEDDLEIPTSHQITIDGILDYLSLEHRKVTTKYRKVIKQPLEELIFNYDEFVKFLNKYGWQDLLNNTS